MIKQIIENVGVVFLPYKILKRYRESLHDQDLVIRKLQTHIRNLNQELDKLHGEDFISDLPLDCSDPSKHDCNL